MNTYSRANERAVLAYLENRLHVTPAGAAGFLGNTSVETGGSFSTTSYNPTEHAIGLQQWENGRRTSLQQLAARMGGSETDLRVQLAFIGQELRGGYRGVLTYLQHAKNPTAAAHVVQRDYEGSSTASLTDREQRGAAIYSGLQSGQLTPGTVPAGAGFTGGDASKVPVPITPDSLGAKLNPGQRTTIINWLVKYQGFPKAQYQNATDTQLISWYKAMVAGLTRIKNGQAPPPLGGNPFSNPFGWVVNLVYKGGFAIGGVALVVLGAAAAAKSSPAGKAVTP